MATLVMRLSAAAQGKPALGAADRKVTVRLGRELLTLPLTSPRVRHSDIAADWVEVSRAGQAPLLRKRGPRLRRMEFDAVFVAGGRPVEGGLRLLDRFANAEQPLTVGYGPLEGGPWRLVDVQITSDRRQKGTNAIVRAEATLTFVEYLPDGYPR